MSTIKVTNLQNASAASPAIVLDANSRATLNGLSYPTEGSLSGRNRIINGDMRIDQRNAGASVTSNGFSVDRFYVTKVSATVSYARSTVAPTGFTNSLGLTVTTGAATAASDTSIIQHAIEGFNIADLGWGTAGAQPVTLSFWVRSSVTGNYGASLRNGSTNRSYVATYAVNAANIWEYKTLTIAGDTSGTWATDNSAGVYLNFDMGVGSTYSTTAGSWQTGNFFGLSGGAKLQATTGATFYITGVQLEAGSVATPFERRSYGQELLLCQRYYETGTVPLSGLGAQYSPNGGPGGAAAGFSCNAIPFAVTKRATPTVPSVSTTNNWVIVGNTAVSAFSSHTFVADSITANGVRFATNRVAGGTAPTMASLYMWEGNFTWTASAEL